MGIVRVTMNVFEPQCYFSPKNTRGAVGLRSYDFKARNDTSGDSTKVLSCGEGFLPERTPCGAAFRSGV